MIHSGYAIVDGTGAAVRTFTSRPDRVAWPNGDITQPAALMTHRTWAFVERWDDFPAETRTQKPGEPAASMVDGKLVRTAVLVDKSAEDIAAWDAARIPAPVSSLRFRLALLEAGILDDVEAYVAGAPRAVQLAWEFHGECEFDNPMVLAAAAALNVDDAGLRALFVRAATLEPGQE